MPLSVHGRTWEATDSSAARKGLHNPFKNKEEKKERIKQKLPGKRDRGIAKPPSFDVVGRRKESSNC